MTSWSARSWREKPIQQQPDYPSLEVQQAVEAQLKQYPPLVFAEEIRALRANLARVSLGKGFLLQGGDCADTVNGRNPLAIEICDGIDNDCDGSIDE